MHNDSEKTAETQKQMSSHASTYLQELGL